MALDLMFIASAMTPAAFAGTVLGGIASRGRSRLEGDIALAIIMGCATFQWNQPPRAAPNTPQPQVAIKLDTKLLDTFVGQYQFPPDNVFWAGMKLTIVRQGDQLVGKALFKGVVYGPFNIYPDSETNFLVKGKDGQLTFIKSDKGEITAVISRLGGSPDNEGRKLNN